MEKGITHLNHVYHNDIFMSLPQLIQKYGIRSTQFLQYQQLRPVICLKINSKTLDLPIPISEFINITATKTLLSKIYQIIAKSNLTITIPIRQREEDLSSAPDADFWIHMQ